MFTPMNFLGATALLTSFAVCVAISAGLRERPVSSRRFWLCLFAVLSLPALSVGVYYLHIFPDRAWFFTLRSWTGSEFLLLFLGAAAGAAASLVPRPLRGIPLFILLSCGAVPYIKPLVQPLPDGIFKNDARGDICLQSTISTCGPASVATILHRLGVPAEEGVIARAAYSSSSGTEAWYLARYIRNRGLSARFDFRPDFTPEVGLPALVGVNLGGTGHFIAVLDFRDDQVDFADPLRGEAHLSLADFQRAYDFTGFHLVVRAR